jgi:hypothetical protein
MVVELDWRDSLDKVFRALEAQAKWAILARQLGESIRARADLPARVRTVWEQAGVLSLLAAETCVMIDRDKMGRSLEAEFDSELTLLYFLTGWVQAASAHGQTVDGAANLKAMIAELETMRSEALDNWPWTPTKRDWDEGIADFERGDSLPADEAFAEIAGTDKETWLRRVEEYKRRRGGGDAAQ